ncbi:hypothetical protein MJT46_015624 [Ovis ammon polii x Ovis aries]|nr:hypothetical protein MJT46_015624 [Ovis ammon polii x Ovis aries]
MDPAPSLGCSLKDVKWSSVAVPLDLLVSTYRLPQIARLDSVLSNIVSNQLRHHITVADECLEKELIFVPVLLARSPYGSTPPLVVNMNQGEMSEGF